MKHTEFVPLHIHTEYSLLDGAIRIDELVEEAAKHRMPALAITDHGNLFGSIKFYQKAQKAGLKPIIGAELYLAPGSRLSKEVLPTGEKAFHLILLAKNLKGYQNLMALSSKGYLEGFYYKPRIDIELLSEHSDGLIGLSACMHGEIPYYLANGEIERAREAALRYKDIFGSGNFFIELQDNGIPEQYELNKKLLALAKELNIPVVATNDCHYLRPTDAEAHDILLCIQTNKKITDRDRLRFSTDQLYFKSPEQMQRAFQEVPEALKNTLLVAEMCNLDLKLGQYLLPTFKLPRDRTAEDALEELALQGLKKKVSDPPPAEYLNRLRYELDVIKRMGFASYFLIVWDFIDYAKKRRIPVGPGRGSAAGSLVAYCLGITEIDPIRYNLLFERFLNPDRISMPDIDIDFCKQRRDEVLEYVKNKYGHDHVANIITFGTMKARQAIRDVGRALDVPYSKADKLAKMLPEGPDITIKKALETDPSLMEKYNEDETTRKTIDNAIKLEGICRHASVHAAGVVISPEPLTRFTALYKNPGEQTITTQLDMKDLESIGLLKFDFLGLKTLTVIDETLRYLNKKGIDLDINSIPLDDPKTYKLLSEGKTTGVFQLESEGMKELLVKMQPERFEDLIAIVALYRPGPLESGMVDEYI
ncbi:MAG: DNA polymerase III subunit alpha, partial [Nitrospirae bacterium]